MKKRMLSLLLCGAMCAGLLSGCGNASSAEVLNVYNWGEYIDTDLIDRFEEETGIKVIYNTFDSNENLYSRIQTTSYDVIIPSDYAISRFIDEDMLQPLNYDHIPNMKLIDEKYTHLDFDPEQKYSVPYTWGVVGIVYNTKYVDEADIGSWDLLWNPKYTNRTAMFNNSRDALGIALMYLAAPSIPPIRLSFGRQPTSLSPGSRCIRASGWTRFSRSCRVRKLWLHRTITAMPSP
ncbi:extracellular solute-binding protein [Agathobaculum butyriciproducens]|nr:extracellular solute-binding protein [Agathobaculum butyriciproducens]